MQLYVLPPISGELLGESVGRVRTSRQDHRESEKGKGDKRHAMRSALA